MLHIRTANGMSSNWPRENINDALLLPFEYLCDLGWCVNLGSRIYGMDNDALYSSTAVRLICFVHRYITIGAHCLGEACHNSTGKTQSHQHELV